MCGLGEGDGPYVLDGTDLVKQEWDEITGEHCTMVD